MPEPMYVLVVGDTHGNAEWTHEVVIPRAVEVGATKILQVGDFGFIWPSPNYTRGLDRLNKVLDRAGIDLHFLPGNHEDYDKLELLSARARGVSPEGHIPFRSRLFYTGKVSAWSWNGRRCAAVGGATSIDRQWREPGKSWWPQEALTPEEAAAAVALRRTEVLFTHDAPTQHPFEFLTPDPDSTAHRQVITDVARTLRPQAWFHGHYHAYAKYPFVHDLGCCEVTALNCDGTDVDVSTAVLALPPLR